MLFYRLLEIFFLYLSSSFFLSLTFRSQFLKNFQTQTKISEWKCPRTTSCHRYKIWWMFAHSNSLRWRSRTSSYSNSLSFSTIFFSITFYLYILRRLLVNTYHILISFSFSFICHSVVVLSSWIVLIFHSFVFVKRFWKRRFSRKNYLINDWI